MKNTNRKQPKELSVSKEGIALLLDNVCRKLAKTLAKVGLFYNGSIFHSEKYNFLNPVEIVIITLIAARRVILESDTGTGKSTFCHAFSKAIYKEEEIGRISGSPNLNESVLKELVTDNGHPLIIASKAATAPAKVIDELNRILPSTGQAIIKGILWDAEMVLGSMNPNDEHYSVFDIEPSITSNCAFINFDRATSFEDKKKMKLLKAADLNLVPLEIDNRPVREIIHHLNSHLFLIPLDLHASLLINSLKANCCHQYLPKNLPPFSNLNDDCCSMVNYFEPDDNACFFSRYDGCKPPECNSCGCNCEAIGAMPDNLLAMLELTAKALAAIRSIRTGSKLMADRNDLLAASEFYIRKYTVRFKDQKSNEQETAFKHLAAYNNAIVQFIEDFRLVNDKITTGVKLNQHELEAVESFRKTVNPSVSRAVLDHFKNQLEVQL